MKKVTKIVFSIIATLMGAGFASGQEINIFFYSYGMNGILGLVICSILMIYIIYKVLKILKNNEISNYKEFVCFLIGDNSEKKYLNLGYIINVIVNLFLVISFFIMIAGFGAYFSQEIGINNYVGSGALAMLCFFTFMGKSDAAAKINAILIPILIIFIIVLGIINITTIDKERIILKINHFNKNGWILSSILYCSYNSIFLIPAIITFKKYLERKKDIVIVSVISGVIVFILAITIYLLLTRINININKLEMPIIYIVSKYFTKFKFIYAFIILASIYTTAISIGISILENISKDRKSYMRITLLICTIGFLISGVGFSNLIRYIYPIFGFLGLIQIGILTTLRN